MAMALEGVRVVELASAEAAFAGKLLAGLGADVVLVEPPGGHATRRWGPFVDGRDDAEASLWWWHHNAGKRSVTLDVDARPDLFRRIVDDATVVIEAEAPGRLHGLGIDYVDLERPDLIWASVTSHGRASPASTFPETDLTIAAGSGPAWSCGYDDHSCPPVRPGGNQTDNTAAVWAVIGVLTALVGGTGQLVDVSRSAASNVTTELAVYQWLVRGAVVQRQTLRHAQAEPTISAAARAADGRWVTTGVPPRSGPEFGALVDWIDEAGARDDFPDVVLLELGRDIPRLDTTQLGVDGLITEIYAAGREALLHLAGRYPAAEFFEEGQGRGFTVGAVFSPDEVLANPHFVERGFAVTVSHPDVPGGYVAPGAPFRSTAFDFRVERAPFLGEHDGG